MLLGAKAHRLTHPMTFRANDVLHTCAMHTSDSRTPILSELETGPR